MKKYLISFAVILLILILAITGINLYTLSFSRSDYYVLVSDLEEADVGLVLGAAVYKNRVPSQILKDRLEVAYDAYETGKIKKIIVSGDNSRTSYNEPEVMKKYLVDLGVMSGDIYMDYAGFDTYDSIYRAKAIFGMNELIIFTQDFHLKRAMYISKSLGIGTEGMETNLQMYSRENYYQSREILARIKAFIDVEFNSKPKYLGETIEIVSDMQVEDTKNTLLN